MEENGKERSKPPRPLISYCIKPSFNEKENIYLKTKKKKKKMPCPDGIIILK